MTRWFPSFTIWKLNYLRILYTILNTFWLLPFYLNVLETNTHINLGLTISQSN